MFTLNHVLPKSLGGSDESDNLALACRRCNERRYNFVWPPIHRLTKKSRYLIRDRNFGASILSGR